MEFTITDSDRKRFFSKVERIPFDTCWHWTAKVSKLGYGWFSFRPKDLLAHRMSWIIHKGNIPQELCILHKCDVRHCVNPDHLFLGSHKDNSQDMIRKKRHKNNRKTHCTRGHEYNEINMKMENGSRRCILCAKLKSSNRWKKIKAKRSMEDQCSPPTE